MALTKQISRNALILQPTNAEVSTNQTYSARYTFVANGEQILPVEKVLDSLKHVEAATVISKVWVSARIAGTSTYRVKVVSYDSAGANEIEHVNHVMAFVGNGSIISIPIAIAGIPDNRGLQFKLTEETALVPAEDITVTVIADDFADLAIVRNGHVIENYLGSALAQEDTIRFGEAFSLSDVPGERTVVEIPKSSLAVVGDVIHSMLTEAQFQSLRGTEWVLADGRSVVGSQYQTITGYSNIPDLRGQYLRGKNNGRSDGNQNPDGDLGLGTFQDDQFESHTHAIDQTNEYNPNIAKGMHTGAGSTEYHPNLTDPTDHCIVNTGGNETRPKSVTVNIFIKIN